MAGPTPRKPSDKVSVWDRFVRTFHWSLVGAVSAALVSGMVLNATWIQLHIIAGTSAAALVFARIVWGFFGTTHARLATFVAPPRTILEHLAELRRGRAKRHLGHNPLGGVMILGLAGTVLALLVSGVISWGGIFKVGPAGPALSQATGNAALNVHNLLSYGLLALVVLHVGGAIFESLRTHENLPLSMVTGTKERRHGDHTAPPARPRPALSALLIAAGLGAAWWGTSTLASRPGYGVPDGQMDATYADECSACHMAYAPSLLDRRNWAMLMAGLPDHFGEDASLDPETTARLADWLAANAAETADTKPSHVFRQMAADAPFTLTKSPFWIATHQAIPEAEFKRAPIYNRGNCAACHQDADSGRYYPGSISIPKETTK